MTNETHLYRQTTPNIKLTSIALPAEHGSWGFLLEPIFIGLLIAPSIGGLFLSLATVGAFLARFPMKIWVMNLLRKRVSPRVTLSKRFTLFYASLSLIFFALALTTSKSNFLIPILIATPFAIWQLIADFRNKSRTLSAEIAGALALASVASGMAIINGWTLLQALCVWLILAARIIPSILYVRAKIRQLHKEEVKKRYVVYSHLIGLIIVSLITWKGFSPYLVVLALLILHIRAIHGLTLSTVNTAKAIGIREIIYGTVTAIALAVGYSFNL